MGKMNNRAGNRASSGIGPDEYLLISIPQKVGRLPLTSLSYRVGTTYILPSPFFPAAAITAFRASVSIGGVVR